MMTYEVKDYFAHEWPIYEKYLEEQQETVLLREYRQQYQNEEYEEIIGSLLMSDAFYAYLQKKYRNYFTPDYYAEWAPERARLHAQLQSVSYLAKRLRASDLRVSTFLSHQFWPWSWNKSARRKRLQRANRRVQKRHAKGHHQLLPLVVLH